MSLVLTDSVAYREGREEKGGGGSLSFLSSLVIIATKSVRTRK